MDIAELLLFSVKNNASDLHLSAGLPPLLRVDGDIRRINAPALDHQQAHALICGVMNDEQRKNYSECLELDFAFELPRVARFRVNAFNQERGCAAVFRIIPSVIPTLEALQAPQFFAELCKLNSGLVLVTGTTGSGKSTTLAAMINHINAHAHAHILTVEDPIEFVHQSQQCVINQREVYRDTLDFNNALRAALREDPDIILLGEMRDLETIRLALSAAETGHLVFASLHTASAAKAVNRIIDVFPAAEKALIRTLLSESLQAVIAQTLLKKIGGGRIAAHEIMVATPAVRHLIGEAKIAQLYSTMQTGRKEGMQTLDQNLKEQLDNGLITAPTAASKAVNKALFY